MEEMKARIKMLEHHVQELEEKLERILNYISI
jgi:hypothetical protein